MTEHTQHWAVTVCRNGEEIVTIESNCLSGRELSVEDTKIIHRAACNLLGFIGAGQPPEMLDQALIDNGERFLDAFSK